jgi:enterochelin esterase-like enzyme
MTNSTTLCDYFVGTGIAVEARSDVRLTAPAVLLTMNNAARAPRYSLVYVQVDFTRVFAKELLPHLPAPVFVLTGQHVLPMLHR